MTSFHDDIAKVLSIESKEEAQTLSGVVNKLKAIAEEQYGNMLYDNIYSIFNQLTVRERRILLKGITNVLLLVPVNTGPKEPTATVENNQRSSTVNEVDIRIDEDNDVEKFNKMEMIKLKSRLSIIAIVTLAVTLFGAAMVSVFYSESRTETISIFSELGKIISEVLGF